MKPSTLKSNIYLAIATSIVLIWVGFIGLGIWFAFHAEKSSYSDRNQQYSSEELGIEFSFPKNYALTARHDLYQGMEIHVLIMINASTTVPDMSEGPTAISVIELPITPAPNLEAWVRDASISNFNLSPDKAFSSRTVDGKRALAYRYSGLYESDAVAVEHGGKVYLFAASWMDQDDKIREDFQEVLRSVRFKE